MQLRIGTFLQNRYEILELIGSGGMSFVYRAKCHKLNRLVAIKVLKDEFSKNDEFVYKFKMEAQSAAGLSHPNIVNVYDVIDEGDLHYIVMEYVEGITLKTYIRERKFLDIKEAISISIQVARGIKSAHDAHIVHRDIKPQNIIISKDGSIKVADFGIARAISEETLSTVGVGSIHYMSPEQAKGEKCDKRSDIYSLGISMYEMLTGRLPFEGDVVVSVALAHLEEKMPAPSIYNASISPRLDNIILTCTRKNPDKRYADLADLIEDLEDILVKYDYENKKNYHNDTGETRIISASELNAINSKRKNTIYQDEEIKDKKIDKKHSTSKVANEENTKLDRWINILGIVIALIIVTAIGFFLASGLDILGIKSKGKTAVQESSESTDLEDETKTIAPNLIGLDEERASLRLKALDLQLKVKSSEYSDEVEKGEIISQNPKSGEEVSKFSAIEVIVSKGSEGIDLSKFNLIRSDKESALSQLENAGVSVQIVEENNDEIPSNYVIRYAPTTVKKGERLSLYVSKGKKEDSVVVPDFTNYSIQDVKSMLTSLGLSLGNVKEEYSDTYLKGKIIEQSILKDTTVVKNTKIDFTVSLGKQVMETIAKNYKYIASIDTTYNIEDLIGPGSSNVNVSIMVRLRQNINGETKYTTLMEPRTISGNTILPVRFKSIEGAYGVEQGYVEVVELGSNRVLKSYEVEFFKVE